MDILNRDELKKVIVEAINETIGAKLDQLIRVPKPEGNIPPPRFAPPTPQAIPSHPLSPGAPPSNPAPAQPLQQPATPQAVQDMEI
ncbi:MAG: hypothetical protein CEN91_421 [Candidatus Berkelbacteria bacterium Licking1014_85]|uniref:Uncharacterized protein n=1 Tax=Candidatus Berkelbacteria bacterium Licking1014_85 TaxID=2017148 RepID=A0A554LI36_9BACT|nr:MAG: hypothetical protein CEN91_421 [Candidatus Berkelbacteria bacterium Licking1014_85]